MNNLRINLKSRSLFSSTQLIILPLLLGLTSCQPAADHIPIITAPAMSAAKQVKMQERAAALSAKMQHESLLGRDLGGRKLSG